MMGEKGPHYTPNARGSINMKQIPKVIRAYEAILNSPHGITENEILYRCRLSSGRNYPTQLERILGIVLCRVKESNPDGIGDHLRYRILCREDAEKVARLINLKRNSNKLPPLDPSMLNNILALYPSDIMKQGGLYCDCDGRIPGIIGFIC